MGLRRSEASLQLSCVCNFGHCFYDKLCNVCKVTKDTSHGQHLEFRLGVGVSLGKIDNLLYYTHVQQMEDSVSRVSSAPMSASGSLQERVPLHLRNPYAFTRPHLPGADRDAGLPRRCRFGRPALAARMTSSRASSPSQIRSNPRTVRNYPAPKPRPLGKSQNS